MDAWDQTDKASWTRWSTKEYEEAAYKRAQGVVMRIIQGQHPMGRLNLLTELPTTVWYPYLGQAERMAERIWGQLQQLIVDPTFPSLQRYNFEVYVEQRGTDLEGNQLATIIFRYNPDDVRDLSLDPVPHSK